MDFSERQVIGSQCRCRRKTIRRNMPQAPGWPPTVWTRAQYCTECKLYGNTKMRRTSDPTT